MDEFRKNIKHIRHVIKEDLYGVVLSHRGDNDRHVMITLIEEDDENWSISSGNSSSFYIDDLITVLKQARAWIHNNCARDKDGGGWHFKNGIKLDCAE